MTNCFIVYLLFISSLIALIIAVLEYVFIDGANFLNLFVEYLKYGTSPTQPRGFFS